MVYFLAIGYISLFVTIGFQLWFSALWLLLVLALCACSKAFILQLSQRSVSLLTKVRFFSKTKPIIESSVLSEYFFVLSEYGQCQFGHRVEQQLSPSSQSNLWGYWLVFTDRHIASQFIFKDSLSNFDQARIGRTLNRLKQSPNILVNKT